MNEGYRKRLEAWLKTQKTVIFEPDKPYDPKGMRARAPLGCIILTILFGVGMAYLVGWAAGYWKFLF